MNLNLFSAPARTTSLFTTSCPYEFTYIECPSTISDVLTLTSFSSLMVIPNPATYEGMYDNMLDTSIVCCSSSSLMMSVRYVFKSSTYVLKSPTSASALVYAYEYEYARFVFMSSFVSSILPSTSVSPELI